MNLGTAFFWLSCNAEIFKFLVDKGAKLDLKDERGIQLSLCESVLGRGMIVEYLINKGSKLDLQSNSGKCTMCAYLQGHDNNRSIIN